MLSKTSFTGQETLKAEQKEADVPWCSTLTKANSLPTSPGELSDLPDMFVMSWNSTSRWLHSWHMIGLDSEAEAFDIILITHPASVKKLPKVRIIGQKQRPIVGNQQECVEVPLDFDPQSSGPGRCLWRALTPLSGTSLLTCPPACCLERDHRYDRYLNSQECLFNPAASFLQKYR